MSYEAFSEMSGLAQNHVVCKHSSVNMVFVTQGKIVKLQKDYLLSRLNTWGPKE